MIIGFTFHTSFLATPSPGSGCCCCSATRFSWFFAFIGLLVKSSEAVNSVGFITVFPLTFISSAFVPVRLDAGRPAGSSPK